MHFNDAALLTLSKILKEGYSGRHGGDRRSKDFQDGKSTQLGNTRDLVAKQLGISGKTLYNIEKATKLAEKNNDKESLDQLKTKSRVSSKIIQKYETNEELSLKNLSKHIKTIPHSSQTLIYPTAYKGNNLIVVAKSKEIDDILLNHFNVSKADSPNQGYSLGLESVGKCSQFNITSAMLQGLAKIKQNVTVTAKCGCPLRFQFNNFDIYVYNEIPKGGGKENGRKRLEE
jgi:DNA-binding XRE family transcriptional regulator